MKLLTQITLDDLISWRACYWNTDGDSAMAKRCEANLPCTPLELAECGWLPIKDRLWVLLRPEIISERDLHLLACDFAEAALPIYEKQYPDDNRPRRAIEVKRLWINDKAIDKERATVAAAAYAAAADAAAAYAAYAAAAAAYAAYADAAYAAAAADAADADAAAVAAAVAAVYAADAAAAVYAADAAAAFFAGAAGARAAYDAQIKLVVDLLKNSKKGAE